MCVALLANPFHRILLLPFPDDDINQSFLLLFSSSVALLLIISTLDSAAVVVKRIHSRRSAGAHCYTEHYYKQKRQSLDERMYKGAFGGWKRTLFFGGGPSHFDWLFLLLLLLLLAPALKQLRERVAHTYDYPKMDR